MTQTESTISPPTDDVPSAQVLVIDDEKDHAEVMAEALRRLGHVCTVVHDLDNAQGELQHGLFDLVVTDLVMAGAEDGMAVLETARASQPNAETIVVTAHGDVPTGVKAMRRGAFHFIEKPLDLDVFRGVCTNAIRTVMLRDQNRLLKQQIDDRHGLDGIVGQSAGIQRVIKTIQQVAPSDIPVLITGGSGTGKELVARAIHQLSARTKRVFKPLNCAGLTESILESELFGHVKGAFTNAERDREGVFEYASGGTLFLDEIGDMPANMQAKLLRVLESGEIVRVGDNVPRHVNVRLLSATNHDIEALVKAGKFREDLFFRVRGAQVHLPALRERRDDVPLLARYYVDHFAQKMHKESVRIDDSVLHVLAQYDWPGNVRELMNVVQNMVLVCEDGELTTRHVPFEIRQTATPDSVEVGAASLEALGGMTLEQIEKQAIRNALRLNNGNREATAKMLGIGERTLYRKLREFGLK